MEDQEWQPVRIAPVDNRAHFFGEIAGHRKHGALRDSLTGKILRVKPISYEGRWVCGTERVFEIHPDDLRNALEADFGRMITCEHQILAD